MHSVAPKGAAVGQGMELGTHDHYGCAGQAPVRRSCPDSPVGPPRSDLEAQDYVVSHDFANRAAGPPAPGRSRLYTQHSTRLSIRAGERREP